MSPRILLSCISQYNERKVELENDKITGISVVTFSFVNFAVNLC